MTPWIYQYQSTTYNRSVAAVRSTVFLTILPTGTRGIDSMAFIMEFAENLVLKLMEDPRERDRKFREHLYTLKDKCAKTKEMWALPIRPYGFWTFDRHNSQIFWDSQISQVPGRRDPYDDLLQDNNNSST